MSGIRTLLGQTAVYGMGTMVPRFLNYLITPYLTYAFSTSDYGINTELFAYIAFFNILFTYGFETAYFNFQNQEQTKNVFSTAFWSITISTLILGVILMLLVPVFRSILSTPNATYLNSYLYWCIGIIATDALAAIPFAKLRSGNKALQFSFLKLLNVIINLSLTVFFLSYCRHCYETQTNTYWAQWYRPEIGIGYVFLATLISNIITTCIVIALHLPIPFSLDAVLWKSMWNYAWPLVILGVAAMINDTLDKVLLKWLMPNKADAQVSQGIYGACNKLAVIMSIFIQAFRFAYEPYFFKNAGHSKSPSHHARIMTVFILFCCFIFLSISLNMSWIQYFIGSSEYRSGISTVPILLLAYMCLGIVYNLSIWYKLSQHTQYGAIIALSGAATTILINVLFMPLYGYWAATWATFLAYLLMMVLSYIWGKRHYPIPYELKRIGTYILITLVVYALSYFTTQITSSYISLLLNNLFILSFAYLVYRIEIRNYESSN